MIIVAGTVRIDPAKSDAARVVMQDVIAKSRIEDGCLEYCYAVDVLDASIVRVYEMWRDREALQAHFNTAHLQEWRKSWLSLGIYDRKLKLFEVASSSVL